jgi:hypothetical protein
MYIYYCIVLYCAVSHVTPQTIRTNTETELIAEDQHIISRKELLLLLHLFTQMHYSYY